MNEIVKLNCPSCGGKLKGNFTPNQFTCEHCGNTFAILQNGDTIALKPLVKKLEEASTVIIGNGVSVVRAENVIMHKNDDSKSPSEKNIEEKGECPICGKLVSRDNSFRCKHCKRPFICISHQDVDSFLCSDCVEQAVESIKPSDKNAEQIPSATKSRLIANKVIIIINLIIIILSIIGIVGYYLGVNPGTTDGIVFDMVDFIYIPPIIIIASCIGIFLAKNKRYVIGASITLFSLILYFIGTNIN